VLRHTVLDEPYRVSLRRKMDPSAEQLTTRPVVLTIFNLKLSERVSKLSTFGNATLSEMIHLVVSTNTASQDVGGGSEMKWRARSAIMDEGLGTGSNLAVSSSQMRQASAKRLAR
jgi:hypothetical protein